MVSTPARALQSVASSRNADEGAENFAGSPKIELPQAAQVRSICREFDVEIIPANEFPKPGQTRCLATMCRILATYGEGHFRLVVSTLAETKGNQGLMTEVSLWAVSDLCLACAGWIEANASEWLASWDAIPLGWLMWRCQELTPIIKQRHALVGMMYLLLTRHREGVAADRVPDYGWLRRVERAEQMRDAA